MSLTKKNLISLWGLFFIGAFITAYRFFYISIYPFDLYADEAQYWTWSKVFDFGYYSKPPMIAWLISYMSEYCGDAIFCIKSPAPLLHFLTSLLVYGIGSHLFDKRIGFWSGILYLTLPAVTLSSTIISTDVPLLFFWALAMYCFVRAMEGWQDKWWGAVGVIVGLGLLSKYTMILFLPSALWVMLSSKEGKLYLGTSPPWFGVVFAFLIFFPNILWNYSNDFVSVIHTTHNANIHGIPIHPDKLFEFIASQLGVFGPILFVYFVWILSHIKTLYANDKTRVLLCFIIPFFVVICSVAFLSRAHANWAAPIYIPATILVVYWALEKNRHIIIYTSLILHITAAIVFHNFNWIAQAADIKLDSRIDPFKRVRNWQEFGRNITGYLIKYPDAVLFSDGRKTVANLMYLLRSKDGDPYPVQKWNADKITHDHYDMTTDMNHYLGSNFLFVTRGRDIAPVAAFFDTNKKIGEIKPSHYEDKSRLYSVYYLTNFKGY